MLRKKEKIRLNLPLKKPKLPKLSQMKNNNQLKENRTIAKLPALHPPSLPPRLQTALQVLQSKRKTRLRRLTHLPNHHKIKLPFCKPLNPTLKPLKSIHMVKRVKRMIQPKSMRVRPRTPMPRKKIRKRIKRKMLKVKLRMRPMKTKLKNKKTMKTRRIKNKMIKKLKCLKSKMRNRRMMMSLQATTWCKRWPKTKTNICLPPNKCEF